MSLNLVEPPSVNPVSDQEIWDHLQVNMDPFGFAPADADRIARLIEDATSFLDGRDGILGRCLVPQTWDYTVDQFPRCREIVLRLPPVISIVSVSYVDGNGDVQIMDEADYALSADRHWRPRLLLAHGASWPATRTQCDAVTIRMICGYDSGNSPQDAAGVPPKIRAAMKLIIRDKYDNPQETIVGTITARMPLGVDALLAPYRLISQ